MAGLGIQIGSAGRMVPAFLTGAATRVRRRQRHSIGTVALRAHEVAHGHCHCGVCSACVANEELEEARFARHLDPDYYRRSGALHWESPLRGGVAVVRTERITSVAY